MKSDQLEYDCWAKALKGLRFLKKTIIPYIRSSFLTYIPTARVHSLNTLWISPMSLIKKSDRSPLRLTVIHLSIAAVALCCLVFVGATNVLGQTQGGENLLDPPSNVTLPVSQKPAKKKTKKLSKLEQDFGKQMREQEVQAQLDEINSLRKQMGSIGQQLEGIVEGQDANEIFRDELGRLAKEDRNAQQQRKNDRPTDALPLSNQQQKLQPSGGKPNVVERRVPVVDEQGRVSYRVEKTSYFPSQLPAKQMTGQGFQQRQPLMQGISKPSPVRSVRSSQKVRSDAPAVTLRASARRLEEVAAELEEVGLVREADELRSRAQGFWRAAR